MASDLLSDDSDIVAVSIYRTDATKTERSFYQDKFMQTYGLDKGFFAKINELNPVPLNEILHSGEDIWNASVDGGPPLIGYGRLVVAQDERGRPLEQWAIVGFVKLDRFLKSVSLVQLSEVFVANRRGQVLVRSNASSLLKHPNVGSDPLFVEAEAMPAKISVVRRDLGHEKASRGAGQGF
ncbi:MAG: hypothetical protein QM773_13280 [Hyphomonadaceae bacterium]